MLCPAPWHPPGLICFSGLSSLSRWWTRWEEWRPGILWELQDCWGRQDWLRMLSVSLPESKIGPMDLMGFSEIVLIFLPSSSPQPLPAVRTYTSSCLVFPSADRHLHPPFTLHITHQVCVTKPNLGPLTWAVKPMNWNWIAVKTSAAFIAEHWARSPGSSRSKDLSPWWFLGKVFFLSLSLQYLLIYLAPLGLSCSMPTLTCSMWDVVPWPRFKPGLPALWVQSLSQWTTKEVLGKGF